jgi:predicted RND superfamily exporter protein
MKKQLTEFSINHPWIVISIVAVITLFFAFQLPNIKIDTDPENMLAADEPVRVFDHEVKEEFGIHDFIAVGVIVEDGAFNQKTLTNVYNIIEEVQDIDGVIAGDIMAPSTVDDIKQTSDGILKVETLLEDEPESDEDAQYVLGRIKGNPILKGKLGSDDGKALAMFIPIESKNMSYRISQEITAIVNKYKLPNENYYIAGLPVAQDSFGAEMFKQMAISAPMAGAIIFLLMFLFFRNLKIIIAPMIVAIASVIWTMGLLIVTGHTVHIMSSMIPIFLIPIAVLNSIHIISEFHDRYQKYKHKKTTIRNTISDLFMPMLFTSLTTIVGFLSLATTPIPPVRVFGIFVAFGIFTAWILSLTFNPAFAVLLSDKTLRNFGKKDDDHSILSRIMHLFRNFNRRAYKYILIGSVAVIVLAVIGLNMIVVNDNPVKWFKKNHPLRVADAKMNQHLAGTYMNYLVVDGGEPDALKNPELLKYIEGLQKHLEKNRIVGSTAGITDIVKKVRYELFNGAENKYAIPDDQNEVAQDIFLYEISGGDPDDLFKLINTDYSKANIWVQMTEGDNRSVASVVKDAETYLSDNPPPAEIDVKWAGLPYVNIVWQQKMVGGMRSALLGSFAIVFIMMIILFRSFILGLISMLPLSITIMAIYAAIGYIGKPYDMPIAVLSSLTLGLSIDFAIHFIKRSKYIHERTGNFRETFSEMFESLGRAITRNVLVIAIGFVPMFFSTLVPYVTVGSFFFAIMMVSGAVTMLLLPSLFIVFNKKLFPVGEEDVVKVKEQVAKI